MLTDDAALREVTLNPGGLRDSIPPGAIHLTMGTHGAGTIQELAAVHARANQILAAAPVLGRPDMAASGQLGIVAAGPADALQKCEPLFQVMGRRTFHAGAKPEHSIAIKLANNFLLGCAIGSMAEGFSLVRKYGVVPQVFYEVMTESLFAAPAYKVYGKIIVELKAVSELTDDHRAQVHNYLKATGFRLGLLVNFGGKGKLGYERIVR